MKTLYKLHFNCGRHGVLYGLFIAEKDKFEQLVNSGKTVYFGEVLGKHSDVHGPIEEEDYTEITSGPNIIKLIEDLKLEVGYNPMDYINEEENNE